MIALGIVLACCSSCLGLGPSLDVSQYAHTAWKVGEELPDGAIRALAQTSDGYLWLGTEFGLLRFDGVRTVPWQPAAGEQLPHDDVRSLLGARDGRLWIGTFRGLTSWNDGKLTHYPELDGQVIEALLEDREGTIWVAGWAPIRGRLCKIQSNKTECYGDDGRFGYGVTPLYEDSAGNVWAGAMNGLWRWKPGPPKLYPMPNPGERIYALAESDDGGILVAKQSGITKLRNGKTEPFPLPASAQFKPFRLLRDRDGGLWIGAVVDRGLMHIHSGRSDQFTHVEGLSHDSISSLFEDREGNIWVASVAGLDRFRDFAVPRLSAQQGLSSSGVFSVLAARDGSLWLGMSDGLNRLQNGQITIYRKQVPQGVGGSSPVISPGKQTVRQITDNGLPNGSVECLFQDGNGQIWIGGKSGVAVLRSDRIVRIASVPAGVVYTITEDGGRNVWISHQEGLFRFFQERLVERIPWVKLGRREPASAIYADAGRGGLWLGFRDGGVAYLKDGQVRRSYSRGEGLGGGMIRSFYADGSGSLWAATEDGLSRIKDGRVLTLTSQNGLPCNTVHWMIEDDAHSVWLYLACGLVRIARSELEAWVSHPKQTIRPTVLDSSDGVRTHRYTGGYNATVAKTADGRLWFLSVGAVSVLDPHHIPVNKLPPPVHIEQIIADEKTYDAKNGVRLHPHVRNMAIDYTALSLVAPEKVRFRYKLEGMDPDWREVVNDRQVQYTNLRPGHYRFRVIACNNSGVWNEQGAAIDFVIPPMWYQTYWFYVLCVAAFLLLVWSVYKFRIRQLAYQFNLRMEERVGERTRIARDLHDTLLQSFQGLLPLFQVAIYQLPKNADDSRTTLQGAIDRAACAITEGRDAVQGLRISTEEKNDLAQAIETVGQEIASSGATQRCPRFSVVVAGASRELHPILRDEVYRVAAEALRNSFRHADAQTLEVEIRYDKKYLRVRIRDDGKGISEDALNGVGLDGHYGLRGMRERARIVGGKLTIWSEPNGGTEIDLMIPASKAFAKSRLPFWRFGKRSPVHADVKRDAN